MTDDVIEITFNKLNHFWMDSGLLGLYEVAEQNKPEEYGVSMEFQDNRVLFKGTVSDLDNFFQKTYELLLSEFYNTSTQKQKTEKAGFYYNSNEQKFVRYPLVKTMGIAGLIFGKAPRPVGSKWKYEKIEVIEDGKKVEKKVLPSEHRNLQNKFEAFLKENNLKITANNLPVDGPNAYKDVPKVKISLKSGAVKGNCFICGGPASSLSEIGGTVFPMISGSSGALSFNSNSGKPERICWKCDYISKFVPVIGFYTMANDNLYMYFPYSSSLEKMYNVSKNLNAIKIDDPNLFKNFLNDLGGYFQKPFEQLFSFLYSIYRVVLTKKSNGEETDELDYEKLFDIVLSKAPVEFFVIHTETHGQTQMGKGIWEFQDSVYLFRLLDTMEKNGIDTKEVMKLLVDHGLAKNEDKTLVRNRICERILKKQSVVSLIEQHVFRINKSEIRYIKPLQDFVVLYEKILREGENNMNQETIDTAVSLGKTIGMSIAPFGRKGKGDLFRLRKARKPEDFLNEINRIQLKYGMSVTANLYNKGKEFEDHFVEFKQFCMIAALNTFNAVNQKSKKKNKEEEE